MYARVFCALVLLTISTGLMSASAAESVAPKSGQDVSWTGTIADDVFSAGRNIDVNGTVEGDAFLAGSDITVDGSIQDSAYVAGGQVHIDGNVANDLIAAGGTVETRGHVGDNLIAAGGNVRVSSQVDGKVIASGGSVRLDQTATVKGDAWLSGGSVRLDGDVTGGARLNGGDVVISGHVAHDVTVKAEHVRVADGARIDGNLVVDSPNEAEIANGAVISGTVTHQNTARFTHWAGTFLWIGAFIAITAYLYLFIVGLLMILICPGYVERNREILSHQGFAAFGIGALFVLAMPALIVVLVITVIGIPFAVAALLLYLLALMLSMPLAGTTIARAVAGRRTGEVSRGWVVLFYAVTLLVFWLIGLIPFLGGIFSMIITMLGLGVAIIQMAPLFRGMRRGVQPS